MRTGVTRSYVSRDLHILLVTGANKRARVSKYALGDSEQTPSEFSRTGRLPIVRKIDARKLARFSEHVAYSFWSTSAPVRIGKRNNYSGHRFHGLLAVGFIAVRCRGVAAKQL
jgi:hypothetical protein